MSLIEIMKKRRSIREYTNEDIPPEIINDILKAGQLAPSSKNIRPIELLLIEDKNTLEFLSKSRTHGSTQLKDAKCAIITIADTTTADAWIEDASITMTHMMLMAQYHNIGNCWIQIRMRKDDNNKLSSDIIKEKLGIPKHYEVEAILSLGISKTTLPPQEWEKTEKNKVHKEKY